MKGIGLSRIADAAGVSVATVSNTINRPHLVAEATRERVRQAMERLDFVPNRAAATLRRGSNKLLGVVVPELINPFYAAITESIAVAAGRRGYALALCVSHDDAAVELSHFEMLAEQRAAGAIVVPYSASEPRLRQLRMVGTHLVLVDRVFDAHDGCAVAVDDIAGGALATRHHRSRRGTIPRQRAALHTSVSRAQARTPGRRHGPERSARVHQRAHDRRGGDSHRSRDRRQRRSTPHLLYERSARPRRHPWLARSGTAHTARCGGRRIRRPRTRCRRRHQHHQRRPAQVRAR